MTKPKQLLIIIKQLKPKLSLLWDSRTLEMKLQKATKKPTKQNPKIGSTKPIHTPKSIPE
ncbi:hypothetical protein G9A89_011592 [Geosiphon pyriformis]|nr:hypothetical protein G9A89_011592 [Geosiphon pyriformis]